MLVFVLLIGILCMFAMFWILNTYSGDQSNKFNEQTTTMKEICYNNLYVTGVLKRAWSILNSNETSANVILYLASKRADYSRKQLLCKKKKENKLPLVEKNYSNLFPGLRAGKLKSNGIDVLDINDTIGHQHG